MILWRLSEGRQPKACRHICWHEICYVLRFGARRRTKYRKNGALMYRRLIFLSLAALVAMLLLNLSHWSADAANTSGSTSATHPLIAMQHQIERPAPAPAIEPYVRPQFARQMRLLRPTILDAARRHNRPELSNMSDHEFAATIALILYNENFGSLEDRLPPLRPLTPLYQNIQISLNEISGGNMSVWPANLRPSVALEILQQQIPVPDPTGVITEPIHVAGSKIDIATYPSREALYAALTQEITEPHMAVEYLAANLERGLYRAHFEGVPVTWRVLAAWHNQGIVTPQDIRRNPIARDYVRRTSAYIARAYALIDARDCVASPCKVAYDHGGS